MLSNQSNKQFAIQQLFMYSSQFERHEIKSLTAKEWKPEAKLEIANEHKAVNEDLYEVQLKTKLMVSLEGTLIFTMHYIHAGLFLLKNLAKTEEEMTLNITACHVMYPYATEAINSLVQRAGYPAIYLTPIDFNQMYEQRKQHQNRNPIVVMKPVATIQ